VLIEGGSFTMGANYENLTYEWDNIPRRVTVPSFYMDQTEVSNLAYLEYLYWLNRVFVRIPCCSIKMPALIRSCGVRNLLIMNPWLRITSAIPHTMINPVVGVSWVQASDYCVWRPTA